MKTNEPPVIVEQNFDVLPEVVWYALTQEDKMRQWFFEEMKSFRSEPGFETRFAVQAESQTFVHFWKVTEVIPMRKLTLNWKYEGFEGDSFVTFELNKTNGVTKLKLTHFVVKDFLDSVPEFSRQSCQAGWDYFIKERLKDYLEKKTN